MLENTLENLLYVIGKEDVSNILSNSLIIEEKFEKEIDDLLINGDPKDPNDLIRACKFIIDLMKYFNCIRCRKTRNFTIAISIFLKGISYKYEPNNPKIYQLLAGYQAN